MPEEALHRDANSMGKYILKYEMYLKFMAQTYPGLVLLELIFWQNKTPCSRVTVGPPSRTSRPRLEVGRGEVHAVVVPGGKGD